MMVKVHMLAFMDKGAVREVEIDDSFLFSSSIMDVLEEVFKMGQNDFQPLKGIYSVSVGDVIEYEVGEGKYWLVNMVGFLPVSEEEFNRMEGHEARRALMNGLKSG